MTDPSYTHVFFLLDRSGSMQMLKQATEEGFAAYIRELADAEGTCRVSLSQFDTYYDHVFHDLHVSQVRPIHLEPRGGTALLDAIGRLIQETGKFLAAKPEAERPGNVIVGIMTDGEENASREFSHPMIKALIEEHETKYSWTFQYMGANQDAIEVGASIGIAPERSITYDVGSAAETLQMMGASNNRYRRATASGAAPAAARQQSAFTDHERRRAQGR